MRFRLAQLLEERGITQTELQMRTGLAYSTINDLANNKTARVSLATIDSICGALDCRVEDLLEYVRERRRGRS